MVIELAMFVGGLAGVVAIGTPVVVALSRPHRWSWASSTGGAPQAPKRPVHTANFTPLDLGPDPVEWPSQREWPSSAVTQPPWPSQSWDDEHFGSHWRDGRTVEVHDLGFHAMAGRRFGEAARAEDATRRNEEADRRRPQEALHRPRPQQQPPQQSAAERERQAPRPQPQRAVPQVQPPSAQELEALIAKVGLAGTVQTIMDRTGWDFRRAAHYLAKIRQGG